MADLVLWSCWCFFSQNMGSVVVVKPHQIIALPFVVMAMLWCDVCSNSCCTRMYVLYICNNHCFINLWRACAAGYSSWLCLCPVQFFHTVTNWPRRPTDRLNAAKYLIKTWSFFVKHLLYKATKFTMKLLVQLSASLFVFASTRAYFNHMMLLLTTWCFSCRLWHCVVHRNIAYTASSNYT